MKKVFFTFALLLAASAAKADGFVCQTESGLNVKVFNHVQPTEGTRTAAIMVISDSSVGDGNKTIAKFNQAQGTLSSEGSEYTADVDLRFKDSRRKGENIAGTKLGELQMIQLKVDFSYATPTEAGDESEAVLILSKRNGEVLSEGAVCTRYLKN